MPRCIDRDYACPIKKTLQPPPVQNPNETQLPVKQPKNIIRCSDGYIEEYSTDDEQIEEKENEEKREKEWNTLPYSDVKSAVSWSQLANVYFWRNTRRIQWLGWSIGEFAADFLGITSARYQSEIDMALRQKEEQERQEKITEHCYVNEAGELEMAAGKNEDFQALPPSPKSGDYVYKVKKTDTVELDHKGIEIPQ